MRYASKHARPQIGRAALVARFGERLAASLDFQTTARRLAELMTLYLADMCIVDVLDEDGRIGDIAVAASDPALASEFHQLRRRSPLNLAGDHPTARVLRRGRSELLPEMDRDMLTRFAQDRDHERFVRRVGYRSVIIAPLVARGHKLGAVSLLRFQGTDPFEYRELMAVDELARHASLALDNARLHSRLEGMARTLGSALLPERLPELPGLELIGRYHASGELNEVGGDFYDVFECGESGWALAIGDVCGKGPLAARTTALARYTLRTAAMQTPSPSGMLQTLNTAIRRQLDGREIATACVAAVRPGDGRARVTLALAGHPRPLLVRAGGEVTQVGKPGSLLGFGEQIDVFDTTIALRAGDTLLLYTDGITDAGKRGARIGEEGLEALVAGQAGAPLRPLLASIVDEALGRSGGRLRDDVALLALRVRPRGHAYADAE
jgi:serine phosphatase RsbU (regulator of sigma subunit)